MVADPYVDERPNSRRGTTPYGEFSTTRTWSRDYIARGYESEIDGRNAVAAYLDANDLVELDECPLKTIVLTDDLHDGDWVFEVNWELKQAATDTGGGGTPTDPPESKYEYSFDIGAATRKCTKSISTTIYHKTDVSTPNFDHAIGVNKDSVEGVDVIDPEWSEEYTFELDKALATATLKGQLFYLVGKTNSDNFLYYKPGEARFDGCRGGISAGDTRVRFTLKISGRPNEELKGWKEFNEGMEVSKKGWQYVWVFSQPKIAEATVGEVNDDDGHPFKFPTQEPVGLYVEDVYEEKPFALLQSLINGTGTGSYTPST